MTSHDNKDTVSPNLVSDEHEIIVMTTLTSDVTNQNSNANGNISGDASDISSTRTVDTSIVVDRSVFETNQDVSSSSSSIFDEVGSTKSSETTPVVYQDTSTIYPSVETEGSRTSETTESNAFVTSNTTASSISVTSAVMGSRDILVTREVTLLNYIVETTAMTGSKNSKTSEMMKESNALERSTIITEMTNTLESISEATTTTTTTSNDSRSSLQQQSIISHSVVDETTTTVPQQRLQDTTEGRPADDKVSYDEITIRTSFQPTTTSSPESTVKHLPSTEHVPSSTVTSKTSVSVTDAAAADDSSASLSFQSVEDARTAADGGMTETKIIGIAAGAAVAVLVLAVLVAVAVVIYRTRRRKVRYSADHDLKDYRSLMRRIPESPLTSGPLALSPSLTIPRPSPFAQTDLQGSSDPLPLSPPPLHQTTNDNGYQSRFQPTDIFSVDRRNDPMSSSTGDVSPIDGRFQTFTPPALVAENGPSHTGEFSIHTFRPSGGRKNSGRPNQTLENNVVQVENAGIDSIEL